MSTRFSLFSRLAPLLITILLISLTGCQQTPTTLRQTIPPHVVLPTCNSALPLDIQQGTGGAGDGIPVNIYTLLHFYPHLPVWLPDELNWNSAVFMTPSWKDIQHGITPFFRAEYSVWQQRQPARSIYGSRIVLALDESSTSLEPSTGMLPSLQIHMQKTIKINNLSGKIYQLTSKASDSPGLQASEVIWQMGGVFLRLSTVTKGKLTFQNKSYQDTLLASPALTDATRLRLLQSSGSFSQCHQ